MAQYAQTAVVAPGATTATVTVQHGKGGRWWLVWQYSVITEPVRLSAVATVMVNNLYRDSTTTGGQATASGPPAWVLNDSDTFSVVWQNLQPGDEAILNLLYEEVAAGQYGSGFGLV